MPLVERIVAILRHVDANATAPMREACMRALSAELRQALSAAVDGTTMARLHRDTA